MRPAWWCAAVLAASSSLRGQTAAVPFTIGGLTGVLVDTAPDGEVRVLAPAYKLVAGADDTAVVPYRGSHAAAAPVRFRLLAVRRGAHALPLVPAPAKVVGDGELARDLGGVEERWLWRERDCEQRFVVDVPEGAGDLVLTIACDGAVAEPVGDGVRLWAGGEPVLHYGDVTTIAADGRKVQSRTRVDAGHLQLVVPEAFVRSSAGALVVDPVVTPLAVDTGNDDVRNPEVAFLDGSQPHWFVVYERHFSAFDIDIVGRRYRRDGTLREEQPIATGTRESRNPAVAANTFRTDFLIVWDEDRAFDRVVLGRSSDSPTASLGTEFVVHDHDGASNTNPTVGGTNALDNLNPSFFVVSEAAGQGLDYALTSSSRVEESFSRSLPLQRPRLSRVRHQDGVWLCVSELAGDVFVELCGGFALGNARTLATPETERQPTVTSGGSQFVLAFVRNDPATGVGRLFGRTATVQGTTLSVSPELLDLRTGEPGANAQRTQDIPAITTDGRRIAIAYRERQANGVDVPFGATAATAGGVVAFHEGHAPLSTNGADTGALAIAAEGEFGLDSVRTLVVFDRVDATGARDIVGTFYDARQPGPFVSTVATGCRTGSGGVPPLVAEGTTMLGGSVTLTLQVPGLKALAIGFPIAPVPLCPHLPSGCARGVELPLLGSVLAGSTTVAIPTDPGFVGLQLAVQGVAFVGTGCDASVFGVPFSVSDTAVLTVR